MSLAMQPLAASSSSAYTAPDGAVNRRKADETRAHGTEQGEGAKAPKGRHALLAALSDALEGLASASAGDASAPTDESSLSERESKQALHAFAHELFAALRPAESEGRTGRGFAWGRTSSADFAQRLDALVRRLQGGAVDTPSDPSVAAATPDAPVLAPTPPVATTAAETPGTASTTAPVAGASVTLPIPIDVDPLFSAFEQLLAVRHPADTGGASGSGIDALVAFLQRMSQSLGGQAASSSPVPGTLLDVTA